MINKGRAALVAVLFFGLVKPETTPEMWIVSFLSILMYETILLFIKTWQRASAKKTYIKNITAGQKDMERVEAVRFGWKIKEVS